MENNLPSKQEILKILSSGDFEAAASFFGSNEYTDMARNLIVEEAFNLLMSENKIERAVSLFDHFILSHDAFLPQAIEKFNLLSDNQDFINAYFVGNGFDISRKRTLTAGVNGLTKFLVENDLKSVLNIETRYNLLHDQDIVEVDDEVIQKFNHEFIFNVVQKLFGQNKIKMLKQIIDSLGLFRGYETNPLLSNLVSQFMTEAVVCHKRLMNQGNIQDAQKVVNNFNLLDKEIPLTVKSDLLDAAIETHHKKLNDYELNDALSLKKEYVLFVRNDGQKMDDELDLVTQEFFAKAILNNEMDKANHVKAEYGFDETELERGVTKAVNQLMEADKLQQMCKCVQVFKVNITEPKIISEVRIKFHQAFEKNEMALASNLAYYFKIDEPRAPKANLEYWKSLLDDAKYPEAKRLRKERKISRETIEPVIKEYYKYLVEDSRVDEAERLLLDYKMQLSLWEWITNKVKNILGG